MHRFRSWFPLLGLLVGVTFGAGCSSRRPNVLLVTVSGLRADVVDAERAPNLAALDGRLPAEVVVPVPDTAVALEALVTGQGLDGLGNRYGDLFRVPPEHAVLAEKLRERGYRTVAFVGDGALSEMTGLARGFETFHSPSGVGDTPILTDETYRMKPQGGGLFPAEKVRDGVGAWLADHAREGRFFLWVHLGDLSAATGAEDPRAAYDRALGVVDQAVGDILGALRTYGVDGETEIAVVSLHGEALGVRGETGHGIFLSDEVIRVPAWLLGPGGRPVEVPPGELDLGGLGRVLAGSIGVAPGGEPGNVRAATWWPSRLYGWPNDAPPAGAAAVLEKMSEARRLTLQGNVEKARAVLREIAGMTPTGLAPRTLLARNLGMALREAKKEARRRAGLEKELESVLDDCRRLAEDDLARRFDLARLLVGLGRKEEALSLAGRLEREAATAGERLALAQLYAEAGASERAAEIVGALAEEEPGPAPELRTWQGDLLRRAGNTYQARRAYEQAIASPRGRTPEVLAKLGDCLASLGEKEEALRRYAEAVNLDPAYRYPHVKAAEILLEEGRRGEAATAIAMSVADRGDPVALAVERARNMLRYGLHGPAAEELSRALEKEPGNSKLLCWLARVYAEAGEAKRARELLDRVIEAHPDNPLAWEERARLAVLSGDEDEALRCLRKAETYASPVLVERVRRDPVFRKGGEDTPLARFAARFGEGRRPRARRAAAPPAEKGAK